MKRTVFTVIIMLILVMFFAACGWKVEIVDPTKPIENDSELVVSEEEEEKENEEEEEVPEIYDFTTMKICEGEETSEKDFRELSADEKRHLEEILQKKKWEEVPENWEGKGGLLSPTNYLKNSYGDSLYISPEGENTLIVIKYGYFSKNQKCYYAPKEVAFDVEEFRKELFEIAEEEEAEKERLKKIPSIEGDYVELETNSEAIYQTLEFEDKIVIYYVSGNIAAFDIKTGEKLYEYFLADVNKMCAFDMMKNDYREGFDFSVCMFDKIVYLSSENPELIENVFLPESIAKDVYQSSEEYSIYENKIVWISHEGIKISDISGENEEVLIPTSDIEKEIKPIAKKAYDELYFVDNNEPCIFYEVSFICGGEKIAVTVTSDRSFVYWATALYDIESGEFEWAYLFNEMVNADYPFGDRYIQIGKKWVDAETGYYKNIGVWTRSANGTDFLHTGWQTNDFELYCDDIESIEENGKLILKIEEKTAEAYVETVMENYVLIHIYRGENGWDCLVKYK